MNAVATATARSPTHRFGAVYMQSAPIIGVSERRCHRYCHHHSVFVRWTARPKKKRLHDNKSLQSQWRMTRKQREKSQKKQWNSDAAAQVLEHSSFSIIPSSAEFGSLLSIIWHLLCAQQHVTRTALQNARNRYVWDRAPAADSQRSTANGNDAKVNAFTSARTNCELPAIDVSTRTSTIVSHNNQLILCKSFWII